jgi:hypothetical protein
MVERPETLRAVKANVGYVRRLMRDLLASGLAEPLVLAATPATEAADVVFARIVARLSADYVLRALQLLVETFGDIRAAVVAQTILTANTAHLDARDGEGWRYLGVDEIPPDEVRKPISIARLAESLGLPYETMRGQARRLIDAGVCARVHGGLVVPSAVLERPAARRATLANVGYVRRFVRDLQAIESPRAPHGPVAVADDTVARERSIGGAAGRSSSDAAADRRSGAPTGRSWRA